MSTDPTEILASSEASLERKPGELAQLLKAVRAYCMGCCGSARELTGEPLRL